MSFAIINRLFGKRRRPTARAVRGPRWKNYRSVGIEALEAREVLSATTYVDDGWAFVSTGAPAGVLGDHVNNGYHDDGSITGVYGTTAFGAIQGVGSDASADEINDAIAATDDGGTVRVLNYAASGAVTVDEPVALVGEFTVSSSGNLTLDNADAALAPINNGNAGKITLSGGTLALNAGSLYMSFYDDSSSVDLIEVHGAVSIASGVELHSFGNVSSASGSYVIIDNDASDLVGGTFAGLFEGASLIIGDRNFTISYTGGTGNDVVLTAGTQMPFTSYVDSDWAYDGTLDPGDTVTNTNDSPRVIPVTTFFHTNYSTGNGWSTSGYDSVADAVAATAPGGNVIVLQGPGGGFTEDVTVNKKLALQGSFILNGALDLGAQATLLPGFGGGTLSVEDLTMAAGTQVYMNLSPGATSDLLEVSNSVDLGGATLNLQFTSFLGSSRQNITLIDNTSSPTPTSTTTGTFAGLPEGAKLALNGELFWITYEGGDGNDVELVVPDTTVAARKLFYNQSGFDGNSSAMNASDDAAIATDKSAYLPDAVNLSSPPAATFANVSTYSRGINGIMVDLTGSHPGVTANDFYFRTGVANDAPSTWAEVTATPTITVRSGAGVSGSDRVEITWASGSINNTWLEVTVLATLNTGLAEPDVFYFGNQVGDTGPSTGSSAVTSAADATTVLSSLASGVPITNTKDFNRDGNVTAADKTIVLGSLGFLTYLQLREAPAIPQVVGPSRWQEGVDVTLSASIPLWDNNTPSDPTDDIQDPGVDGMKFYQDVNANGILDTADVLIDSGTLESSSNGKTWTVTFDPAVLAGNAARVLAVATYLGDPVGAGSPGLPWSGPTGGAGVTVQLPSLTLTPVTISAAAYALNVNAGANGPYFAGPSPVAGASAFAVGKTAAGGGQTSVHIGANQGQIIAAAGGNAYGTAGNTPPVSTGSGAYQRNAGLTDPGFGQPAFVVYEITSATLPVGSPVNLVLSGVGYVYGATIGATSAAGARQNFTITSNIQGELVPDPDVRIQFANGNSGFAATSISRIVTATVGEQITVNYRGVAAAAGPAPIGTDIALAENVLTIIVGVLP